MPAIRLIKIDSALGRALDDAGATFEAAYGASPGANLQAMRDVVAQTLALLSRAPRGPAWGGYLAADEARRVIVGTCGFTHGPEADGAVEIAYFTFPEFEGQGYATLMARALIRLATDSGEVTQIVAHTLPVANASTRILEKVGLRRAGEARDPEAGTVWKWLRAAATREPHGPESSE